MPKLSDVEREYKACLKIATPHRHPPFGAIRARLDDNDPDVHQVSTMIEESNTGYDGILIRHIFVVPGKERISFQADLLPNAKL